MENDVSIEEFREPFPRFLLEAEEPVAITPNDSVVRYYVPTPGKQEDEPVASAAASLGIAGAGHYDLQL